MPLMLQGLLVAEGCKIGRRHLKRLMQHASERIAQYIAIWLSL